MWEEGGWPGDVLVTDWEDLESVSTSEVHVKRFTSPEVTHQGKLFIPMCEWFPQALRYSSSLPLR